MPRSERIDVGPPIAIVGALLLLASLFLDWYEPGVTAWTVFEVLDLVLAALAIGCLLAAATRLGVVLPAGRALSSAFAALAVLSLVLVLSQVLNHPPAAVDSDPDTGLWLGLAGAGLLALGGLLSVTRISLAVDAPEHQGRGTGPVSPPPAGPGTGSGGGAAGGRPERQGTEATTPLDVPSHEREQR